MQINNPELQNSSLDLNELENDNTENIYLEEHISQGNLEEHISQGNLEEHNSQGNLEEHNSQGNLEEHILEELNIEENSDELLNDSGTLDETNLVSNANVLENESNTIVENVNQLEEINVEEINNLNSSNNELNIQLTNMKEGLTMDNNPASPANDNDNILINSLIDNALATNDEDNNIDEGKDYSSYSLGDYEKLTLKELQDVARQNKLKIKGKKNELVDRVKAHYNFSKNLV